ncbi:longevity assurance factor, putative [Entamoeba invadens IP1]|uniref:Longevity assurance factor, putative n=2 Tax=Entamoeba invadens TaxID=33085 RepID=A0A0A1U6K1_ENTIV|nr:longevity assurance factor, putative [Entamoeba invadens IP1]ELP87436.1 longevity assurance factor, putative [Entamoeba invadens IP1]BAN42027.1 longevity assurance factor, putative [Entamoeba invadens]|eukprot:XP_004254207.1 longevity assurance factor, putative [Entamoeba invadens IP1]
MKVPSQLKVWSQMSKQDQINVIQIFVILPFVLLCIPSSFGRSEQYDTFPSPFNLLWFVPFFTMIYTLRVILAENLFLKLGEKIVVYKQEWTPEIRQVRVQRFSICFFKACYFFFTTPMGILLFRYEDWFPSQLYGKGAQNLDLMWEDFPFQLPTWKLTFFYCWELGYHFHSLVHHMSSEKRADYFENLLHHVATVFLIVFSYLNNCGRCGVLVLILHDLVDMIMYFAKSVNDIKTQIPAYISFALLAYSFPKFRIYFLGGYLIPAAGGCIKYVPSDLQGGFMVYCLIMSLLCVLLVLHIYWFFLILQMIYKIVTQKGRIADPHTVGN